MGSTVLSCSGCSIPALFPGFRVAVTLKAFACAQGESPHYMGFLSIDLIQWIMIDVENMGGADNTNLYFGGPGGCLLMSELVVVCQFFGGCHKGGQVPNLRLHSFRSFIHDTKPSSFHSSYSSSPPTTTVTTPYKLNHHHHNHHNHRHTAPTPARYTPFSASRESLTPAIRVKNLPRSFRRASFSTPEFHGRPRR
jgi:hypothetical protein